MHWDETTAAVDARLDELRGRAREIAERQQPPGRRKPRRPAPDAPDADKLAALRDEVKALISDAHGAAKDLRGLLREYRELVAEAGAKLTEAMAEGANAELMRWANHMQLEQNKHSANLMTAVERAQKEIIGNLFQARLVRDDKDGFRFEYTGARFHADEPMPYPDAGLPERPQ